MKRVITIFGDIHPMAGAWFLNHPMRTTGSDGSKIQITIHDSTYSMQITTEGPDDIDAAIQNGSIVSWANEVIYGHMPALRCVLDALGLHLGAVLDPEYKGGVIEGVGVLGSMTRLPQFGTVEDSRVDLSTLDRTTATGLTNIFARSALADVRNALRFDSDCAFFCYRALDGLRGHYAATTEASSDRVSWELLRADLDVALSDVMALKKFADGRRHGGAGTALHADHTHWTGWTRDVVGRFIAKHHPQGDQHTRRGDEVPARGPEVP